MYATFRPLAGFQTAPLPVRVISNCYTYRLLYLCAGVTVALVAHSELACTTAPVLGTAAHSSARAKLAFVPRAQKRATIHHHYCCCVLNRWEVRRDYHDNSTGIGRAGTSISACPYSSLTVHHLRCVSLSGGPLPPCNVYFYRQRSAFSPYGRR